VKKNTETLTDTSKEAGLEANEEKIKYMLLSHHQIAGQNHNLKELTDPLKMRHSSKIWQQQ
jgi:hypothetical protein